MADQENGLGKDRRNPTELLPPGTETHATKFIAQVGCNIAFHAVDAQTREPVTLTAEDLIRQTGLELGHPHLMEVKRVFSELTQVAELRASVNPNFPLPEPRQPLFVPAETRLAYDQQLNARRKMGTLRKTDVDLVNFAVVFATHLRALGIEDVASRLDLTAAPDA